ncbi:MAG: MBL fold metallo-hydrolase [Deltaproteobacteria bacterium]|nr:MBL fold metallo-hydrolase [Deltaproteobacteria bacterium]
MRTGPLVECGVAGILLASTMRGVVAMVGAIVTIGLPLCGALLGWGCYARGLRAPTPGGRVESAGDSVVSRRHGDVTVHAVRTGWVSIKQAHRSLRTVAPLRLPAIVLDGDWTEWLPVTVFVIDHPEGVFLVDAGMSERTLSLDDADAGNRWFYSRFLRFTYEPWMRIDRQLAALAIDPARVSGVVLTHLHADHADGLASLPQTAAVYVGARDYPGHLGAITARWPRERVPLRVPSTGAPRGAFGHAQALTADGRLQIVALPGHSPGHLGVLLEAGDDRLLFAGDAVFSLDQVQCDEVAGIVVDVGESRRTVARIRDALAASDTYLLPAHEGAALDRWAAGRPSRL